MVLNLPNMNNFHPLEVAGRGSETQLQVGKNLKSITERLVGKFCSIFKVSYSFKKKEIDNYNVAAYVVADNSPN